MNGANQALWQKKVVPDVQGRVFTVRIMLGQLSIPVAYAIAGPLVDHLFNPLLVSGGKLAPILGGVMGVGPGRGIGLLYVIAGILSLLQTAFSFSQSHLKHIETELPDAS